MVQPTWPIFEKSSHLREKGGVLMFLKTTPHLGAKAQYCRSTSGRQEITMEITAWRARGARARVSVNFRKFSPCIARARRARAGLTVYPPSRTLEPLAFDE